MNLSDEEKSLIIDCLRAEARRIKDKIEADHVLACIIDTRWHDRVTGDIVLINRLIDKINGDKDADE